jgi:hypothetical protein
VVEAPDLAELFDACARSAFHLEMRDGYALDDPMLIAWRAGHRDDPANRASWWRPWLDLVQTATHRGVHVGRARIISEPVSEYIRFEYDVTFTNVAAGEEVRWLPRRLATGLALPGNDFWLFDDEVLIVNHFSGDGDKVDAELVTDAPTIKLCATAFQAVWERATPHANFCPAS